MDALEALKTRRSIRSFKPDPVRTEVIEDIVDCGRLAATGRNEQLCEFVVVMDSEMRQRIADITDFGKFIAAAAACIALICKDGKYYLEDGSAATQNILVAARAHGLGACWVAGDKKPYADKIRAMLGAPDGYKLVSLVALGHPGEFPNPAKRQLNEVLHWEKF
ncbi:MAG: nitroreductase family protein [Candidatus Hydrogenedentes bacterium]|nr:nitroreductase family protein [Candidatus Hydrogenedentota bacterium]